MSPQETLDRLCRDHGALAIYLFGSRADDGLRVLRGEKVSREGSDLDVGVVFREPAISFDRLASLQVGFEDVFAPLRVDLVPLNRVDALFQFAAVDGHRIVVTDVDAADDYELRVMNRAAELLPIQRQIEIERFGVSTT
ncbi:MAG: nucleotidyltransferase family protein [Thermoanaerobaculia bacterium]